MPIVNQNNLRECGGGANQRSALSPANPSAPSFPRKRESSKNLSREADELGFVPLRGDHPIDWIPAFAGMTGFRTHELFGLNDSRQCAKQRGISLIELIVFIVIIGVAVAGILVVMNRVVFSSADPIIRKQALAIAESMLEEIKLQNLSGVGCVGTLAANAGRSGVSSVCDYDGYRTTNGIRDFSTNDPVGELAAYNITSVDVSQVTPLGGTVIAAGSGVVITVTVTSPTGETIDAIGYRAGK